MYRLLNFPSIEEQEETNCIKEKACTACQKYIEYILASCGHTNNKRHKQSNFSCSKSYHPVHIDTTRLDSQSQYDGNFLQLQVQTEQNESYSPRNATSYSYKLNGANNMPAQHIQNYQEHFFVDPLQSAKSQRTTHFTFA